MQVRFRGLVVVVATGLANALSNPTLALAQELTEASSQSNADIRITVVGSPYQLNLVKSSVAVWRLGRGQVSWELAPEFEPQQLWQLDGNGPVSCWVDLSSGSTIRLYFANGNTQRFLARSLVTSGHLDEMDREALGQAIELSLLALLADREAGLSREATESLLTQNSAATEATEPELPPAPEATSAHDSLWEFGVFYAANPVFGETPHAHGPGVNVTVAPVPESGIAVFVAGQFQLPNTWQAELAGVRLQGTAVRMGGEYRPVLFTWGGAEGRRNAQALAFRTSAGIDVVRVSPFVRAETDNATTTGTRTRVDAVVAIGVESRTLLSGWLALRAGLFLDVVPNRTGYDVLIDDEQRPVLEAYRLRPGLLLGANFVLDG